MTNFFAYLIAIVSVYRKYLLLLLAVSLIGVFLYSPAEKRSSGFEPGLQREQAAERHLPSAPAADQRGRTFASLAELTAAEQRQGYLPIGYFGSHWPATVMEVVTDDDSIEFVSKDGIKHRYRGFAGYRLKAVRMVTAANEETLIVFRSAQKR